MNVDVKLGMAKNPKFSKKDIKYAATKTEDELRNIYMKTDVDYEFQGWEDDDESRNIYEVNENEKQMLEELAEEPLSTWGGQWRNNKNRTHLKYEHLKHTSKVNIRSMQFALTDVFFRFLTDIVYTGKIFIAGTSTFNLTFIDYIPNLLNWKYMVVLIKNYFYENKQSAENINKIASFDLTYPEDHTFAFAIIVNAARALCDVNKEQYVRAYKSLGCLLHAMVDFGLVKDKELN
jgi:hypothetical protein